MSAKNDKRSNRPKRVPLGVRNRISFGNLDPAYHYRLMNDKDGRLNDALAAGYEFVESDEKVGDARAAESSPVGSRVTKNVGQGTMGYLMRIPIEFYEEDQAAKEAKIKETESTMKERSGVVDAYDGELKNE